MDIQSGGYLERTTGVLSESERRCLEAISDYIEACRFSGDQRNDAWVYGI